MPKSIIVLIGCFVILLLGLLAGHMQSIETHALFEQGTTACPSPQHEGEKTIATLVKHEGVLKLLCEKHSTLKSTNSPNKGEG